MKKNASGGNDEILSRVHRMVMSREEAKAYVDNLFNNAKSARKKDVADMERLLVQTPGAQVQSPNLLKEAVAKNVSEFFEKKAYLTQAQRLFPELLKVANTENATRLLPQKKPAGATPTKAVISGGG